MNARHFLSAIPLSVLVALASCDKDSKVFGDSDLSTERSIVTGRVTGIGDSGLVGVVVTATAVNDQGTALKDVPPLTGLTGREGRYSLELRPGLRWKISWQSLDYQATNKEKTVDLGLRETREIPVQRLTYRYGVVAGRTLPGANVAVEGQDVAGRADANGDFKLERVAPGPVEIVGTLRGKGAWRIADSVKPEDTSSVSGRSQIASWKPLCGIAGTIVNQDGNPQTGAVVSAMGGLVRDTTDIQGRFSFDAVPAKGRVALSVQRSTGALDRIVVSTPPEDSTWDLGQLVATGSATSSGLTLANTLVVADSGDIVSVPLLWKLLDSTRSVIGFAWDTSGTGSTAKALRTWGPRLAAWRMGGRDRTISVWACMAAPLSNGGFDTLWSQEATIRVQMRRKPAPLDTLPAPEFSHSGSETWTAPFKVGLSSKVEGASIIWSPDSASLANGRRWDGDSIVLYETTTLWAYSRLTRRLDSRIVRRTFNVRASAKPETLHPAITTNTKLPQGSVWEAYECPKLSPGVSLTLDSGATLTLPNSCILYVDDDAKLEMRAGSSLILRTGNRIIVGSGSSGTLSISGRTGRRASIRSFNPAAPAGWIDEYVILLGPEAGGSSIRGLDLDGSTGSGIKIDGSEVDVIDSRIRNCKVAGIHYVNDGRPATADGIRNDSISNCRWSVMTTSYALGRIATNPGFEDSIHLDDDKHLLENNTWKRQILPIRADGIFYVDNQSSLTLDPGVQLAMATGSYIQVNDGIFEANGTKQLPIRIAAANRVQGWGRALGADGYGIQIGSGGIGSFSHTVVTGSKGNGIIVDNGSIAISDSRLDSNAHAGILFSGDGRALSDTSFERVSASGNRWSVVATPLALGDLGSCPGLVDSIFITSGGNISGNQAWRSRSTPVVLDGIVLYVTDGASLRIDSGSTYVFSQGAYWDIGTNSGTFVVDGSKNHPVRFMARTIAGWGRNPTQDYGYSVQIHSEATQVDMSHLILSGAQANGIIFSDTQRGVGKLDSVAVFQTATPTEGTYPVLLDNATPTIRGLVGVCKLSDGNPCPTP